MMKAVVIYKVEVPFTDKNTKEDVTVNTELKISVDRMKELNAHKVGRAIDVILIDDGDQLDAKIETEPETEHKTNEGNNSGSEPTSSKYTQEELEAKTVNDLKELAEKEEIELTKAKKEEIIAEILEKLK